MTAGLALQWGVAHNNSGRDVPFAEGIHDDDKAEATMRLLGKIVAFGHLMEGNLNTGHISELKIGG